jgi:CTP:molybdopterin cytidylyltransferase MocA
MDIIILAGGDCSPDLKEASGSLKRSGIEVNGKRLLDIVADAAAPLGRLIVVGGEESDRWVSAPEGDSLSASLRSGLENVTDDEILVITVDLPALKTSSISSFLDLCQGGELYYPIVTAEQCEDQFPGMKRTTVSLAEGRFTGGNMAKLSRQGIDSLIKLMEKAYDARKSPLKLARMIGLGTAIRLLISKLTPSALGLEAIETSASKLLGVKVKAVISPDAAVGADIDTPAQLEAFRSLKS